MKERETNLFYACCFEALKTKIQVAKAFFREAFFGFSLAVGTEGTAAFTARGFRKAVGFTVIAGIIGAAGLAAVATAVIECTPVVELGAVALAVFEVGADAAGVCDAVATAFAVVEAEACDVAAVEAEVVVVLVGAPGVVVFAAEAPCGFAQSFLVSQVVKRHIEKLFLPLRKIRTIGVPHFSHTFPVGFATDSRGSGKVLRQAGYALQPTNTPYLLLRTMSLPCLQRLQSPSTLASRRVWSSAASNFEPIAFSFPRNSSQSFESDCLPSSITSALFFPPDCIATISFSKWRVSSSLSICGTLSFKAL